MIFQTRGGQEKSARYYRLRLNNGAMTELSLPEDAAVICPIGATRSLAFSKGREIYVYDVDRGNAELVLGAPLTPTRLIASPRGTRLLMVAAAPSPEDLWLREKETVIEGREILSRLFVVELRDRKFFEIASPRVLGDGADWSPDETRVVYAEIDPSRVATPRRSILKIFDLESREERTLVDGAAHRASPKWSPDGERIAFLTRPLSVFADERLAAVDAAGGPVRELTASLDRAVTRFYWLDGRRARLLVRSGIYTEFWEADIDAVTARCLSRHKKLASDFHLAVGGTKMVHIAESLSAPRELYVIGTDGLEEKRLTNFNASFQDDRRVEVIQWKNAAGQTIEGVWFDAATAEKGLPPLLVSSHGNTPGAYGAEYAPLARYWASRGLSSLLVNYRGSSGYGQAFMEALFGCWTTGPADDIIAGAKTLIDAHAVDPDRLAIGGASGGAMVSATAMGLRPMFKAAALRCGWYDFASLYNERWSDTFRRVLGGAPWERPEIYRKESPITYASRVKTPTLLFCGENDTVSPIVQTELYYAALRDNRSPVEFVRYRGEGHALKDRRHIIDCWERQEKWFREHLGF